jgi:hypothetical protein
VKIIDFLKKTGVLRVGSVSATYKNAKDRPIELQDDMFLGKTKKSNSNSESLKKPGHVGKKALIASIVAFILFLVLSLATSITWLIFIIWLLWLIYVWLVFAGRIKAFNFSTKIGFIILCFVSLLFVFVFVDGSDSESSNQKVLTAAECQPYYNLYNNKVLKISSDGLQGTIGIKIDMSEGCKLKAWYNVLLSHEIPQNPYKRDAGGASYHYMVMLREANQTSRDKYDGYGSLAAVYKNFTSMPDPFADSVVRSELYSQGTQAAATRYFSWGYIIDTNFSESRYNDIFKMTKLEIVNGLPFIEEELIDGGGYSYGVNTDRAAESGNIIKTYRLTIE